MNIILLLIDTMRYDYIGANGNDWIETPNLDRLASQSWGFDRAFSASFPTIPYRTDVMTGKYGSPFHAWKPLPFATNSLPQVLGEAGYATQLLHDTPHLVNGGHAFDYPFHTWEFKIWRTRGRSAHSMRGGSPGLTEGQEIGANSVLNQCYICVNLYEIGAGSVPNQC